MRLQRDGLDSTIDQPVAQLVQPCERLVPTRGVCTLKAGTHSQR